MGQPAARITDNHVCPMVTPGTPPIPHVGGPIVKGQPNVLTGNMPQARVTDTCVCVGPPDMIVKGAFTVLVGGLPAARIGDSTVHGGTIVTGFPTVLIGDAGSGAGGGGGFGKGGGKASAKLVSDLVFSEKGMTKAKEQAETLVNAAQSGTPFCELCDAAAAASK